MAINSTQLKYYVYAYLGTDGVPYYVGKGQKERAYNKNHNVKVPPKSRIVFLEKNLTDIGAYALERRYIEWYGRKDIGTGILENRKIASPGRGPKRGPRGPSPAIRREAEIRKLQKEIDQMIIHLEILRCFPLIRHPINPL